MRRHILILLSAALCAWGLAAAPAQAATTEVVIDHVTYLADKEAGAATVTGYDAESDTDNDVTIAGSLDLDGSFYPVTVVAASVSSMQA